MEQLLLNADKIVAVLAWVVAGAAALGLTGALLTVIFKALDWAQAWITYKLEEGKTRLNEVKFFSKTQVDDLLWETVRKLTDITFDGAKAALKQDFADGKIDRDVYVQKLHEDVLANYDKVVSEDKKEVFETAFKDVRAAIEKRIPTVVREAKAESKN